MRNRWSISQTMTSMSFLIYQREQEWNISKKELLELVKVGILTEEDINLAVGAEFNPVSLSLLSGIL